MSPLKIKLLGCKGCGSSIVELALALTKTPFDYEEVNYEVEGPQRSKLLSLNPLGQVPVMILPDGSVLTESAAMIQYLHRLHPEAQLIPEEIQLNTRYWRWVSFIISAVYPSFTYGDDPVKWTDEESGPLLRSSTDEWRKKLWLQIEGEVMESHFLGEFSALDLYLGVMVNWRPRNEWFEQNCPKIFSIAQNLYAHPELALVLKKNF